MVKALVWYLSHIHGDSPASALCRRLPPVMLRVEVTRGPVMKTVLRVSAAVLALGLTGGANAADKQVKAPVYKAPPPAAATWQGFYFGAHMGYIWSSTDVFDTGVLIESNANTSGVVAGGLVGYNWQVSNVVLGLEGDIGWSDAHGVGAVPKIINANAYDIDWTSHLRGRIGIVPGSYPVLLFVAGGAAFSRFNFTVGETGQSMESTYTGASFGGGVDVAPNSQFILRGEWLHDFYHADGAVVDDYTAKLKNTDTVRAAFIYKIN
jgi:outer membrane immunogenic protein